MAKVNWTDQEDQKLKSLWGGRYSAAEIAAEIGRTRNSVIGRVFRLGLSDKVRAISQQKQKYAKARSENSPIYTRPKPVKLSKPLKQAAVDAPEPFNITMMDLTAETCRWPVNTPERGQEYLFCGHKVAKGSYCEAHNDASIQKTLPNE